MVSIPLIESELLEAERVGRQRYEYNRKLGTNGECDNPIQNDIEGAIGELAFCKWSDEPWSGFQLKYKGIADAGSKYEIRSTRHAHGNLLMHDSDNRDRIFILARLHLLPWVELKGWIYGREGINRCFWWPGKDGKRPCYKIPASRLYSMWGFHLLTEPRTADAM